MKHFYASMIALSFVGILFLLFNPNNSILKHKPQHKVDEFFEHWTLGNEFENPKLLNTGKILKVGKDNYFLHEIDCLVIKYNLNPRNTTESISYFDERYKIVTLEQMLNDLQKECNLK